MRPSTYAETAAPSSPLLEAANKGVGSTRALEVQRQLGVAGLKGRKVADLLIAAVAERSGLTVLHYDRDFDHIHAITRQPTEWVVPAGSID